MAPAAAALVGWIGVTRGPEVLAAISACPPWVIAGATLAHLLTLALLRTWIVLTGFGLPDDAAHVCLVLFSMGTVGLLPIGVGTGPAATVAALGTTDLAAATAAGMVVSAATVMAVLIYAGACWCWRARVPEPAPAEVIPLPVRPAEARSELDLAA